MGSIDDHDTRAPETIDLPIIDISDTSSQNAKRLVQAAIDYGFLYLSPHGTPFTESLVETHFELSKEFFSLPTSKKQAYHVGTDNRGWLGMHNEVLDPANQKGKEFKEAFNIGEFDEKDEPRQEMPECLVGNGRIEQLRKFQKACERTAEMILDLLGEGLGVEDDKNWFSRRHGRPSGCTVRMLHYPSLPQVSED